MERFVKVEERDMLARCNIAKNAKKRKVGWTALVGAVQEYRMQMENLLIPVIVDGFLGPVEKRFRGGNYGEGRD